MHIDDFAPNLSFFFSNGMDPEYTVLGRVARRIWAVAMRDKYGANDRSQKLKYHVQTSGRSLHAQEIDFNDIRTTLQALIAIYDNCNSLHTNAYDEAITTPTDESVRRALAIQLIINREWGLAKNENPNQGAFIIEELTDLVEKPCCRNSSASPSAAACWARWKPATSAARSRKSRCCTSTRSTTARCPSSASTPSATRRARAPGDDRTGPLDRRREAVAAAAPGRLPPAATQRRRRPPGRAAAGRDRQRERVREVLMDAVRVCSLGQITTALFEVGGQYRRNM
jgi:methylmalonyl-CoA mutase